MQLKLIPAIQPPAATADNETKNKLKHQQHNNNVRVRAQ
jgi:hypothetical protein